MRSFVAAASLLGICLVASGVAMAARGTSLAITSPVEGAVVEIDHKVVGKTPIGPQSVSPGKHSIKVSKLGFLEFTDVLEVKAGKTLKVVADLLPFAGVLKITCNVGHAKVIVDGVTIGGVPLEKEIKIGKRLIIVTAPGYQSFSQELKVTAGTDYPINAQLTRPKGATPVAAAGDDLELEPLAPLVAPPPPKGATGTARTGSVATASSGGAKPTPAKPAAGGVDDLDLELAPLVASGPSPSGSGTGGAGTAAPGANGAAGAGTVALHATPVAALKPGTEGPAGVVAGTVEPAKPWYMEHWVWGTAAGVVASGVVLGVVLARRGNGEPDKCYDLWTTGESYSSCN